MAPSGHTIRSRPFFGLDLKAAKIRMDDGAAQVSRNFDFERPPSARLRAGYARLLDTGTNVVKSTSGPSRLFAFERDDDEVRVVIAHGISLEQQEPGDTEWGP